LYFTKEPKQRGRIRYTAFSKRSANSTSMFVTVACPQEYLTVSSLYPTGDSLQEKGKAHKSWGRKRVAIQINM